MSQNTVKNKNRTSQILKITSEISAKGRDISKQWLSDIDSLILENIDAITCDDIMEIYFSLFKELKRWRSSSSGFTGFSEFLIFRALLHSIDETFEEYETGNLETSPILFRSKNYELGQNVKKVFNGVNKFPDVYVMKNGEIKSIIQIKIVMGGGKAQINREVESFKLMKNACPELQGLFISYLKSRFPEEKTLQLKKAGYSTLTLQDNKDRLKPILYRFI